MTLSGGVMQSLVHAAMQIAVIPVVKSYDRYIVLNEKICYELCLDFRYCELLKSNKSDIKHLCELLEVFYSLVVFSVWQTQQFICLNVFNLFIV